MTKIVIISHLQDDVFQEHEDLAKKCGEHCEKVLDTDITKCF